MFECLIEDFFNKMFFSCESSKEKEEGD